MSWGVSKAVLLGVLSGCGVSAALALTAPGADAKSTYESAYGYDRTWNAALRMVRVDNGWKVTEKDDQNGYLLFEYTSPGSRKPVTGTLELVRAASDGPVSVLVQLPQLPHFHEQVMLDALATKMRREYGDPPPRHRKPADSPADAGSPDAPAE